MCIHDFAVFDYSDCDRGIVFLECKLCGEERDAVLTQEDYDEYAADGREGLMLFTEGIPQYEEIINLDTDALFPCTSLEK